MSSPNEIQHREDSIEIELADEANTPLPTLADNRNERQEGKVLVPALLWMAGVPFGIVLLLWFFFFRG